ncbi:MAG: 2-hydroxyacid dehydrogenase [Alphaproteobacteria bacterium]|nr:2-hydroxyacid dehydrogenase [Alphaproteobacteria bacterium]
MATVIDGTGDVAPAADQLRAISIVITSGQRRMGEAEFAPLPSLGLIHCVGAGVDQIDVDAAARRGITITRGSGVNAATVADHAMALLLSLVRRIPELDRRTRHDGWSSSAAPDEIADRRIGIVGMGPVGRAIAQRAAAFGAAIAYTARRPASDVAHAYVESALALASESDVLAIACPDTPQTFHLVDARVLEALGPTGLVVNVGRGRIVDTAALIDALRSGRIAGAGLDVVEGEPATPDALRDLPNVVLTPHVAGASPSSLRRMRELMLANVRAFIGGTALFGVVTGAAP